jgi:hypothetical protein
MSTNKRTQKTGITTYPIKFKPLLDEEFDESGLYTYTELMGRILEEHFKGKNPKAGKEKTLVKGVIHSETES